MADENCSSASTCFTAPAIRCPEEELRGREESYEHDRNFLYLILQPLLLPAGMPHHLPLQTYLNDWTAEMLADPERVAILDERIAHQLATQQTRTVAGAIPSGDDAGAEVQLGSGLPGRVRLRERASDR